MKIGYSIEIDGEIWECTLGGTNMAVLQKKVIQKKPNLLHLEKNKNKREDVYYLEFIGVKDISPLISYLVESKIKFTNYTLYYILITYCNLRVTDISTELEVAKSSVSRSVTYVEKNNLIGFVDELARSVGYWKYKQLHQYPLTTEGNYHA